MLWLLFCVCVRNGACLCTLCVAGVIQTGIVQSILSPFLVKYGQIYSALYWIAFFRVGVCVCVCLCILWSKMRRATTLHGSASDSDTLWASSGPLGGGWVHRVNYTSSPLVWFIALITVGSLKKEKGEEAYKIKKKKTESATVTERETGRIVCECTWGLLVCTSLTLFTAVNYCGARAPSLQ